MSHLPSGKHCCHQACVCHRVTVTVPWSNPRFPGEPLVTPPEPCTLGNGEPERLGGKETVRFKLERASFLVERRATEKR